MSSDVLVLKMFPGIKKEVVESILNVSNLKGLVIETYGAGNAPTEEWFGKAIQNAMGKGIKIVNVSQCIGGSVILGQYETSSQFKDLGVISGKDLTIEAAITKLMYLLGQNIPDNRFKAEFETPIRGEMS